MEDEVAVEAPRLDVAAADGKDAVLKRPGRRLLVRLADPVGQVVMEKVVVPSEGDAPRESSLNFTSWPAALATRARDRKRAGGERRVTVGILASRVARGKEAGDRVQCIEVAPASKLAGGRFVEARGLPGLDAKSRRRWTKGCASWGRLRAW